MEPTKPRGRFAHAGLPVALTAFLLAVWLLAVAVVRELWYVSVPLALATLALGAILISEYRRRRH